ncbi:GNAT family N-acetyltransferase [Flavobacterium sp.]|uniref:GNAT family N-acetyltransferase n=1 Tax=Flavobacterium sp. TaxID=239 RepID=UPI0038D3B911
MLSQIEIINFLYPKMSKERYESFLNDMIPHNYKQLAIFEDNVCIGLTGFWFGTKLWTGKYIEIDNFIVHPEHRKKGIAKMLTDYLEKKAVALDCTGIVLDAFTGNFTAHRFYYNQGYEPRGFHFIKMINEEGLS